MSLVTKFGQDVMAINILMKFGELALKTVELREQSGVMRPIFDKSKDHNPKCLGQRGWLLYLATILCPPTFWQSLMKIRWKLFHIESRQHLTTTCNLYFFWKGDGIRALKNSLAEELAFQRCRFGDRPAVEVKQRSAQLVHGSVISRFLAGSDIDMSVTFGDQWGENENFLWNGIVLLTVFPGQVSGQNFSKGEVM